MKQKETLEAVLGLVSAGIGLGAGIYVTRDLGNSAEDAVFRLVVIFSSLGLCTVGAKIIDDFVIAPYYESKRYFEKYGIKKYNVPSPME